MEAKEAQNPDSCFGAESYPYRHQGTCAPLSGIVNMRSSSTNNVGLFLPAFPFPPKQWADVLMLTLIPANKLTKDRLHHTVDITATDTPSSSSASSSEATGQ